MRQVSTDFRQAARRVMATPLLSFGAMLILALGIGAAAVMADVLDRILLRAPADVWLPLVPRARAQFGAEWKSQPFLLRVIARLKPGVSRSRANEHATAVYRATHTQPWETGRIVVLGDLRPGRAPGSPVGTRV